jgi:hypothetical protein
MKPSLASIYYYNFGVASGTSTARSQPYLGMLRLRPGCWLETTAELAGQNRKIGILDGNANFRLGEESKPVFSGTGKTAAWYFPPADSFLVDRNGSGKFEADRADSEVSPFGPMLAFGNTAFRVKLTANCAALDIQPWPGAAANLTVQSQGAQVRDVTLGWERGTKDWVLLKAGLNQGWAAVPPGVLVFNGCVLEAQTRAGLPLMLVGTYRKLDKTVRATAGQTATLACGGPLEVQLTATKRKASDATDVGRAVRSGRAVAETFVDIEAEIVGRAGESYGTFLTGKNLTSTPTPPQFTITTSDGKKVASGTMGYG